MRTALLLLALFPMAALAQPAPDGDNPLRDEIRRLEQKGMVLAALNRLQLTEEQTLQMLDLAREAAAIRVETEKEADAIRNEQRKAFMTFREEDIRNTGFTKDAEQAAGKADHRGKMLQKSFCDRIEEIEREACLTEEQRAVLERFRPGNPGAIFRTGPDRPPKPDPTTDGVRRARQALAEIHKEKYGGFGAVGRFLLAPGTVEALSKRAGVKHEEISSCYSPGGD